MVKLGAKRPKKVYKAAGKWVKGFAVGQGIDEEDWNRIFKKDTVDAEVQHKS